MLSGIHWPECVAEGNAYMTRRISKLDHTLQAITIFFEAHMTFSKYIHVMTIYKCCEDLYHHDACKIIQLEERSDMVAAIYEHSDIFSPIIKEWLEGMSFENSIKSVGINFKKEKISSAVPFLIDINDDNIFKLKYPDELEYLKNLLY